MSRLRNVAVFMALGILLAGVIFLFLRSDNPKTEITLQDGSAAEVTPLDKMRVRTAEGEPTIDLAEYRLDIGGFVENKLSLTFEDLQGLEAEERIVELPCVEGWTERGLWKGPRLMTLLERAGVLEGADNVVFSSPGGYTTSLTLQDIKETDPLLAYGANGEMLPKEQGFPVRLVVPDRLGYKWIKWVTGIEVISGLYKGYWESRGYSNEADASRR